MYKKITRAIFSLIIFILCLPAHAVKLPAADSVVYTNYYGRVDAIYSREQQIVINDISIKYNRKSKLLGSYKNSKLNIEKSIPQGSYVKYRIKPLGESKFFLLDLQLVSEAEFNEVEARRYDD